MAAKAVVGEIVCRVNTSPFRARTLFTKSVKPVRGRCYCSKSKNHGAPNFGLFFDIDGVIVRGNHILPSARDAFKLLTDKNGKFWVPSVFLTNAGNTLRQYKAKKLSEWLGIQVDPEQVVMSHSPLQMFRQFMDKHVLVSGQGPTLKIAEGLGFTKVSTIDDLTDAFPKLDMVDERHKAARCASEKFFPKIDVVLLLGEPVRWETNLQIIIDVLVTNGRPSEAPSVIPFPHIPVLACNTDLLWVAEAPMPRFGHGCFLNCLESLYYKITGYPLKYTTLIGKPSELTYHHSENILQEQAHKLGLPGVKRIYAIGDNPETDIYGANLFNRYLCKKHANTLAQKKRVNRQGQEVSEDANNGSEKQDNIGSDLCSSSLWSEQCESILVCTGVYNHSDRHVVKPPLLDHNHRDFIMDPQLKEPNTTVGDVLEAVQDVFRKEGIITL